MFIPIRFLNIYPHLQDNLTWIDDAHDWNNHFRHESADKLYSTNDPNEFGEYGFLRRSPFHRSINDTHRRTLNSDATIEDILSSDFEYDHNGLHRPFECMQKEGQLIYLPEFWWHAVLNVGEVAAGGIQTSDSYTPWMKEIDYLGEIERTLSDKKMKKKHRNLLTDLEKQATHYDMLLIHDRLGKHAPFNAVHQFFVGYEYVDLGEYPLAEQYLEEALFMDPSLIEAYLGLARIYMDSDSRWHHYLAERALRLAYVLNHNHPVVREKLLQLFEEQEEHELYRLVQKHEPLPPVVELTKEQMENGPPAARDEEHGNEGDPRSEATATAKTQETSASS